ncbi:hypothetical protein [Paenibacillus sp. Soil724D2]|uniref:hypothetical protein n=1 Tax=Paenibacillus sp. (strain Soil724D2) TaxID=1736392 RepID=UPI000AA185C6|nr:hypothetical protein [Paenibacillus sp. Soil724D2]
MSKCSYGKCDKEATVSGHVWSKDGPVEVKACDKHKKLDSFFEDKKIEEETK